MKVRLSQNLFGLDTLNYWRLHLFQDSVTADYAFCFSAAKFQLFRGNPCPATHTLINDSRFFHESILFVQRERFLLLNVSVKIILMKGKT